MMVCGAYVEPKRESGAKDLPDLVMCSHTLPMLKICTVRSDNHRSTARSHTITRDVLCSSASDFVKNIENRAGGLARDCSPECNHDSFFFAVNVKVDFYNRTLVSALSSIEMAATA